LLDFLSSFAENTIKIENGNAGVEKVKIQSFFFLSKVNLVSWDGIQ
jgi:hypothetical protein